MTEQRDEPREVSLDEAIAIAVLFQKNEQWAEARKLYDQVLAAAPDHPDALHYAGILAHQEGRGEEAVRLIERSLEVAPDRADCYSNLGLALKALGKVDEAVAAYRRAIELNPGHANAHSNLGVLLRAQGDPAGSEDAYRTAIRLAPDHIDAYHNLGVLLSSQRRMREAVACFCKVTTLSPRHPSVRPLLAMAYCTLGETDKAVAIYEEWLQEDPENPVPAHMLAACTGRGVPERASDAYVEATFDGFARSFEAKLMKLSYRAPAIVGALLADAVIRAAKDRDILDAGCGTGLCGPHLAPYARTLTGVDLSGGMLDGAREKQLYDELVKGELTDYLRSHPAGFDVIVSADTLVYFGALERVAQAAFDALRPGGLLIFTVEEMAGASADGTFALKTHGRYTHAPAYVERVLRHVGLEPSVVRAELRMESGMPVAGLAVRAARQA